MSQIIQEVHDDCVDSDSLWENDSTLFFQHVCQFIRQEWTTYSTEFINRLLETDAVDATRMGGVLFLTGFIMLCMILILKKCMSLGWS